MILASATLTYTYKYWALARVLVSLLYVAHIFFKLLPILFLKVLVEGADTMNSDNEFHNYFNDSLAEKRPST